MLQRKNKHFINLLLLGYLSNTVSIPSPCILQKYLVIQYKLFFNWKYKKKIKILIFLY